MASAMTEDARRLIQVACAECKRSLPGAVIRWDPVTDSAGVSAQCHGEQKMRFVGRDLLEDAESVGRPVTVSLFGEDGGRVIPAVQSDEPLRVPVVLGGSYPDESPREQRRRIRESAEGQDRQHRELTELVRVECDKCGRPPDVTKLRADRECLEVEASCHGDTHELEVDEMALVVARQAGKPMTVIVFRGTDGAKVVMPDETLSEERTVESEPCRVPWCKAVASSDERQLCYVHDTVGVGSMLVEANMGKLSEPPESRIKGVPDVTPRLTVCCEGDWE